MFRICETNKRLDKLRLRFLSAGSGKSPHAPPALVSLLGCEPSCPASSFSPDFPWGIPGRFDRCSAPVFPKLPLPLLSARHSSSLSDHDSLTSGSFDSPAGSAAAGSAHARPCAQRSTSIARKTNLCRPRGGATPAPIAPPNPISLLKRFACLCVVR